MAHTRQSRGAKRKKTGFAVLVAVLAIVIVIVIIAFMTEKLPLEYKNEIETYAREYNLDPYLVAAVIETESGFDPNAVSRVGARGLMQIMPETGEWIAQKLGNDSFSADELFVPTTNIRYGCWYLQFLEDRFGSDRLELVAAAYNAGHGRVADWLEDEKISDEAGNLVNIPYEETEKYVKKIARTRDEYMKEYPEAFSRDV